MPLIAKCQILLFVLIFPVFLFAQQTIVLQPDGTCGKDAFIWHLPWQNGQFGATNDKNYSNHTFLPVMEWTWGGRGHRWVLLDLMAGIDLPKDLEITAARLSLYSPEEKSSDGFHSMYQERRKHSVAVVERILEPWEETTVTWNNRPAASLRNQVVLPIPETERSNFIDIDVTGLVQDMTQNPDQNFGFLIRMQENNAYRKLIFVSSDSENESLRPRLEIDYRSSSKINVPGSCAPEIDCTPLFANQFFPELPNGDSSFGALLLPDCRFDTYILRIFDKDGKEVFVTDQPDKGWDGNFRRSALPSGQYSYLCLFNFEKDEWVQMQAGFFLLNCN